MPSTVLTSERILEATEEVLRRYGPTKATVVDVARALGVSHGSVYRHFSSKAALREAVTARWLARAHVDLDGIAAGCGPAGERLRCWFGALLAAKKKRSFDDEELFATYAALIAETSEVISAHLDELTGQVALIIADGVRRGEFAPCDVRATARTVFEATCHFHDPHYAPQWTDPDVEDRLEHLCTLLLRGLRAPG